MKLRKIAALVVGTSLALSLIGAGVGATFTATTASSQQIQVGTMAITATPASCTIAHVVASSGSVACTVTLTSTGTIAPTSFTMKPTISGVVLSEATAWTLTDGIGGSSDLQALLTFSYGSFTSGGTVTYTITWAGLTNASLGNDFTVNFNFTGAA